MKNDDWRLPDGKFNMAGWIGDTSRKVVAVVPVVLVLWLLLRSTPPLDDHPYVAVYLVGWVFAIALTLFKKALFWAIGWITKGNILARNIRKLTPPDKDALILLEIAFEVALSWINVMISLWQITATLLRTVREAFSATPEEIKFLRFPLLNNPELPPESVWAHLTALKIKAGMVNYSPEIARDLVGLPKRLTSFDSRTALAQLERLHVVALEWLPGLRDCAERAANEKTVEQLGLTTLGDPDSGASKSRSEVA